MNTYVSIGTAILILLLWGSPLRANDALERQIFPQDQTSEPATTQTMKGVTITLIDNHTLKVSNGQTFGATVYFTLTVYYGSLNSVKSTEHGTETVTPSQEVLVKRSSSDKIVSFTIDKVELFSQPTSEDGGKSGNGKNLSSK